MVDEFDQFFASWIEFVNSNKWCDYPQEDRIVITMLLTLLLAKPTHHLITPLIEKQFNKFIMLKCKKLYLKS